MITNLRVCYVLIASAMGLFSYCTPVIAEENSATALFEKRILPIFNSPKPSSCVECHLSGVDLKDYIRPSQSETFAALVAQDLIDLDEPENSKILTFIKRSEPESELITKEIRKTELEAFQAWIEAAVSDPQLKADSKSLPKVGPKIPDEVIRHARKDRVLASFMENVWTEVGRCAACHSPDQNAEQVKKHGDQVSWITLNDPEATLKYMVAAGLIETKDVTKSLLLRKPTMQIEHGGGQKMVIGDRTYKQFRRFIDDYAAIVNGNYHKPDHLPEENDEDSVVSEIWLKIEEVPAKFDQQLLQVDLYYWEGSGWSDNRVATSDRPVFGGGKLWQHSLSLTAPKGSPRAKELNSLKLPPGRYLAKIYIDQDGKLQKDFRSELSDEDLIGQVEFQSQWPIGYGKMTIITFPKSE